MKNSHCLFIVLFITSIILISANHATADWRAGRVEIHGPGSVASGYPRIATDGAGGAFIGASLLFGSYDVWVFRVNGEGDLVWSADNHVQFRRAFHQYTQDIVADGQGGCLVLINSEVGFPATRNQLILWHIGSEGDSLWSIFLGDTSRSAFTLRHSMAVVNDQVLVARSQGSFYYQRIAISNGQLLEDSARGPISIYNLEVTERGDSWMISTDSTLLQVFPSGTCQTWTGRALSYTSTVPNGDGTLIAGTVWNLDNNCYYVLEYFDSTGLSRVDTLCLTTPHVIPESHLAQAGADITVSYRRDIAQQEEHLYYRTISPLGIGEARGLCDSLGGYNSPHLSAAGDSGIGIVWYHRIPGDNLRFTQIRNGECRWLNGLILESNPHYTSPLETFDVCNGGAFGLAVWEFHSYLVVQPVDSLITGEIHPISHTLPSTITLSAFPNPFNSTTTIKLALPSFAQMVDLAVYNLEGREVLRTELHPAGSSLEYRLDAASWGSGVYLLRAKSQNQVARQKLLLLK